MDSHPGNSPSTQRENSGVEARAWDDPADQVLCPSQPKQHSSKLSSHYANSFSFPSPVWCPKEERTEKKKKKLKTKEGLGMQEQKKKKK